MFMSPTSKVIFERRSSANFSFTSASSFLMTVRSTGLVAEDRLEHADGLPERGHLGLEVDLGEPRELAEPQVEDVLGLDVGELEGRGHEAGAGRGAVFGPADEGDHLVDDVDGLEQALDDVGPILRLPQSELGPPADDLDLVVDVGLQRLHEVERAGDAVDERHRVDGEVRLQRRVLVEVVEDDEAGRVLLELDHEPRLATGRLVVDVADALDRARLHELGDAGRAHGDRRLVRHLGDDDLVAAAAAPLLDLAHRPQPDGALAGAVGVDDPLAAHDQRAGGEVGALHELHQVVGRGVGVVDEVDGGVDHLAQVVGRDVGGHADRDRPGCR